MTFTAQAIFDRLCAVPPAERRYQRIQDMWAAFGGWANQAGLEVWYFVPDKQRGPRWMVRVDRNLESALSTIY